MTGIPTVVRNNQILYSHYHQLQKDDIVCGRIRLKPGEEHLLIDLLERGVQLIPSATAQLASRSKCFQARIFSEFMLPGTLPIFDTHELLKASSSYRRHQYTRVILKTDRKNAGLGIFIYNDIEELYNQASAGGFGFPFVIQPFQTDSRDIRVIILGDYIEAYERTNPYSFRKNLHCGGKSTPFTLSDRHLHFCQKVMARGQFDYAHIDLMLGSADSCHLMEINLRGGLKGAKICGKAYQEKIDALHESLLFKMTGG
ncbi:MAG: ATP-grasp domain-containing protein [Desulforhopalus sp.]